MFFFLCGLSLSLEFQPHRDLAPGKHPAHIWGALCVYCMATQDHALFWDAHVGIPREPHKTRKGCFIVPISRRWKLRLRKGGSAAQAHPLKLTLQRNDRAEVQIQLPLTSKTPSQVAALLLLDPGVCGTRARECLGQPGMPGPFSAPTCQTLQGAVRRVGSVTFGGWGTCVGGSVGTVVGRECKGRGGGTLTRYTSWPWYSGLQQPDWGPRVTPTP